jgi:DNA-binding IclR family transcriptional regulator
VIGRAMRVLEAFGPDVTDLPLAEVARRAALPKSTVHRLLGELESERLIERSDGGVRLGMRLFELGQLVPRQRTLRDAALPFMEDLREATHQTVHLAVLDGIEVVYVEIVGERGRRSLPSRVGGRLPAYCTGVGKAILAYSPPEVIDDVIAAGFVRRTPHTIALPGLLRQQLARIREEGIAYDREESGLGIVCAATPVLGPDGIPVAGLSVTGRLPMMHVERASPAVKTAALALQRVLFRDGS